MDLAGDQGPAPPAAQATYFRGARMSSPTHNKLAELIADVAPIVDAPGVRPDAHLEDDLLLDDLDRSLLQTLVEDEFEITIDDDDAFLNCETVEQLTQFINNLLS